MTTTLQQVATEMQANAVVDGLVESLPTTDGMSAQAQWDAVKSWLEEQVKPADFAAWLSPLTLQNKNGTAVTLAGPTKFILSWVEQHYAPKIMEGWLVVHGEVMKPTFAVQPVWGGMVKEATPEAKDEGADRRQQSREAEPVAAAASVEDERLAQAGEGNRLDPRYTFDTFIIGKSNQFAHAAAQRVAKEGLNALTSGGMVAGFNPFFLHGGVGLGKTHLMQAVGHEIVKGRPQTRIRYLSAEQFLYTFIRAMRDKDILGFKDIFRDVDVLMIDDIQFIAGKDATQEQFFHTFNRLVGMGKLVLLTADKSPHELPGIEDRLRSRLGSGLTVEMHAPDVETRQAILEHKAHALHMQLPDEVATFLATNINSNVRELEGALNRLAAFSSLTGQEVSIGFAKEQLRDLLRVNARVVGVEDIQRQVADYFKIRVADMHAPKRDRAIARPRQVAMYLCKQLTTRSYPDIGRAFGGRDHTTVMHACQTITDLMERDQQLTEHVQLLEKMLSGK